MQNLIWDCVEVSNENWIRVNTTRMKTGKSYITYISEQALTLMGERKAPDEKIFDKLNNSHRYNYFKLWLAQAGITKKMTFHDLRHTYGNLQIDAGTDPYTLQGQMAHSTVQQTTKYGKHSDQRKREAAERIKLEL